MQVSSVEESSEPRCRHCDLPVPGGRGDFCCAGCASVYRTISELGLHDFYRYRSGSGMPVGFMPGEKSFGALDHPEFLQRALHVVEGDIRQGTFFLSGIHCAGCVWLIESLPRLVPGVITARVNFGRGTISVRFDSALTTLAKISSFLDSLGYRIEPTVQDQGEESREDRKELMRLGVAAVCAMNSMMLAVSLWQGIVTGIEDEYASLFRWLSVALTIPALLYSAFPMYRAAWSALRIGRMHIDLPISIALLGAFFLSVLNTIVGREDVYFDSVTTVIFLLLVGRTVQRRALRRARAQSKIAWSVLPPFARCRVGDAVVEQPVESVETGAIVEVLPHERVPIDGTVCEGTSSIDLSVLTGETHPTRVGVGDMVHAGALNGSGRILVNVVASGCGTRVGRLLSRLEEYSLQRAPIQEFTERVSGYFVVGVLVLALGVFVWIAPSDLYEAIDRTVALLVVSCPCALGLATPLAFGISIARASRRGILVKGTEALERLSRVSRVYLDKTGTLTHGRPTVDSLWTKSERGDISRDDLERLAFLLAATPTHPVSVALRSWLADQGYDSTVGDLHSAEPKIESGRGVSCNFDGVLYRVGSVRWHTELGMQLPPIAHEESSLVVFSSEEGPLAVFSFGDALKEDARAFVTELVARGLHPRLLSGDTPAVVRRVGDLVGLPVDSCEGGLYPEEKASRVSLDDGFTAMVGDGVNDCAAMKAANVGIGVRGGLEVTLEIADVFITDMRLKSVIAAFDGARATMRVVRRNLVFSGFYNILGAVGAVTGVVNPIVAAVLMPLSSLTVLGSSLMGRTFQER